MPNMYPKASPDRRLFVEGGISVPSMTLTVTLLSIIVRIIRRQPLRAATSADFSIRHIFSVVQRWSKRWGLGCVNSPPRPEEARTQYYATCRLFYDPLFCYSPARITKPPRLALVCSITFFIHEMPLHGII